MSAKCKQKGIWVHQEREIAKGTEPEKPAEAAAPATPQKAIPEPPPPPSSAKELMSHLGGGITPESN